MQPDLLDIVPQPLAEPIRRLSWRKRVLAGSRATLLSLLFNGVVIAGLMRVGFPLRHDMVPEAISVELVSRMPGSQSGRASESGKTGASAPSAEAKAVETAAPTAAAEMAKAPQAAEPLPKPASPQDAKAAPERPAPPEALHASRIPEPPALEPSAASVKDHPAGGEQAVPPPPDHSDADPRPRLVEAPSAPPTTGPSQQQSAAGGPAPERPAHEAEPSAAAPVEPPSPAQRPVQSATDGEDAVATPAPPPEPAKPPTAEERRQAANTATLAAMLPFGGGISGNPFTAQSPVAGQGSSTAYRGQVYANFNKAQDVIADARARHLKGQAVVAFTIDDHGNLASIGIAVSSKNPEVDQAALELIRRAAPFPPPPPGAQRSFAPAIGLGLDD